MEQRLLSLTLAFGAALAAVSCTARSPDAPAPATPATVASGNTQSTETATLPTKTVADAAVAREGSSPIAGKKAPPSAKGSGQAAVEPASADLPRGTLVLTVGDSFAGALGVPLGKRLREHGLRSVLEYQTSSYVPTWASGSELPKYIARYNPDLVIVSLGANEFDIVNPEQRAHAVKRLVAHIGDRPCVWVSPPRWKRDTGILAVIRANASPCRYLDSDAIVHDLPRRDDRIHPSAEGREVWADAVLDWLIHEREPGATRPWELKPEEIRGRSF